jgi:hypothetical protein
VNDGTDDHARDPFDPGDQISPFHFPDGHGGGIFSFHESDQMFRHFDDMFRSFDEVFRSMGMAEFPSHQFPSVPSIEQPPPDSGSLRDHMLKQPDSHTPNSRKEQPLPEPFPGQHRPSFFGRLWSPGSWIRPTVDSNTKADTDLDEQVKEGNLDSIFGNKKVQAEDMPPVMGSPTPSVSKRASVRTYRSADGRIEEHYAFSDEMGNEKRTVRRTMGDQTHEVITNIDGKSGEKDTKENFTNMDENDKCEFDQRWISPPVRAPQKGKVTVGEGHLYKEMDTQTRSLFKNLFVFNFPGFPTGRKDESDS